MQPPSPPSFRIRLTSRGLSFGLCVTSAKAFLQAALALANGKAVSGWVSVFEERLMRLEIIRYLDPDVVVDMVLVFYL